MTEMRKINAEAFDIMQYFYGAVHEPLIHCLMSFSGHLDETALKKAVNLSANVIPLIKCCFDAAERRPCWRDHGFTGEDIVHVIEAGSDPEVQKIGLLASAIDIAHEPQIKIYILREKNDDTLCVVINHMVCDGAGFKEYLYLLGDLYTRCQNNMNSIPDMQFASRSTSQLFNDFNFIEKLGILFSKYDLSRQKNQARYCLKGDRSNPLFTTLQITKEEFAYIKTYAKTHGVTVNDLILTAYARVLHKETGDKRIVIPCPVDLRKYLNSHRKHGICNLTSNFICDVNINENDSFEDTLEQVSSQMKIQKSGRNCLKSVLMLEFVFRVLPFRTLQKVFNKIFTIPVTSFTNLGILDKKLLCFGNVQITGAYLTSAVKYVPYFQIAVSTYNDECTLSSNLYGTPEDKASIESFLSEVKKELL